MRVPFRVDLYFSSRFSVLPKACFQSGIQSTINTDSVDEHDDARAPNSAPTCLNSPRLLDKMAFQGARNKACKIGDALEFNADRAV